MQAALVQRDGLQSEGAVYHQMVLMESRGYCPRRRQCCRLPQVGEEAEVAGSLPCAWLGSFQDAADEAVAQRNQNKESLATGDRRGVTETSQNSMEAKEQKEIMSEFRSSLEQHSCETKLRFFF